ncbi:hypothetical protein LNV08_22910, partial [Paucibacter sp. TC2R-5]|uniref:hypothetical protein n=1 Tax=Paucibacter sp. TC2R-5 TaxID=2893555 RepID=UPI0021E36371
LPKKNIHVSGLVDGEKPFYKLSYVSFLVVALALMLANIYIGPVSSPDTGTFSAWADSMILHNFNWIEFSSRNPRDDTPIYFYLLPITLFALAKIISISQWKFIVFLINIALIPVILCLTRRLFQVCGTRPLLIGVAPILFLLSSDFLLWPRYILTDTIYVALMLFATYWVAEYAGKTSLRINLVFVFLVLSLLLSRPSSPPVVMILVFSYICPRFFYQKNFEGRIYAYLAGGVITLFGIISSLVMMHIDSGSSVAQVNIIVEMVKKGLIIHDRPETWIAFSGSFSSAFLIFSTRFVYFFSPVADSHSVVHNLFNLAFFSVAFISIALGEYFGKFLNLATEVNRVKGMLMLLIVSVAIYHSITLIDYDWRYRYPVVSLFIALVVLELNSVYCYFFPLEENFNKYI